MLSVYRAYVLLTCAFFNLNRAPLEDTRGRLWKACPTPSSQALAPNWAANLAMHDMSALHLGCTLIL